MSLIPWRRRTRARRHALLFALVAALAGGAPAAGHLPGQEAGEGGMQPSGHWHPMLDHHMSTDMPDVEGATPRQRAVADRLQRQTRRGTARYSTPARARRAGYVPVGRWSSRGVRHFDSRAAETDRHILDPARPEALLFWRGPDGRKRLAAAMFRAPSDRPPPRMHNPLLRWHAHYVCRAPVAGAPRQIRSAHCHDGTVARYGTTQMLHIWFTGDPMTAFALMPPFDALAAAFGLH
jgi:hypothetical protein